MSIRGPRTHLIGRRRFVEQLAGLGLGGGASLSSEGCHRRSSAASESAEAAPPDAPGASAGPPPALMTFTASTFATLSAICERLLPRDADPGAIDLGVPIYIDRALALPDLASVRDVVVRVMPLVDRQARTRLGGRAFHEATAAEQDDILGMWERGHDGGQHFFPVILSLTLEGAFGDPKYGGNAGGRGFDLIGFRPDPPLHKMSQMPMPSSSSTPSE